MLSEVLGIITRLCKALQTEGFDLVQVSSVTSSTVQELRAIQASTVHLAWYCSLKECIPNLQASGIALECSDETLSNFHSQVTDPFIQHLVENISSRFAAGKDLLFAFTVFDPQYLPAESDPSHKEYGKDKISRLCQHYGRKLEVVEEEKVVKFSPDIDSELVREEWNLYRCWRLLT